MLDLINKLTALNISVAVINDDLKLTFEEGARAEFDEIIQEIRENKAALIKYIKEYLKPDYSDIRRVAESDDYAVSDGQRRLWILSQSEEGSRAYNLPNQVWLGGEYNAAYFEEAIRAVMGRHEMLRTVFRENEQGELRQMILSVGEAGFRLGYKDVEGWPTEKVREYIREESMRAFDLVWGPLVRAGLLRLGPERYIFHYNVHHIVSDGVSMEILGREVMGYYNSYVTGERLELPALRIQYKDFAAWQQEQLETQAAEVHRSYWMEQLGGELPVLELPADGVRPPVLTHNGYVVSTVLGRELTEGLRGLCQRGNGTLFMGLLGVLDVLLYRYTGQEDIIIGSPVAGREHAELENQIGFYLNTVALRTRLSGKESFEALLARLREVTLSAYEHQMYPFDRLVSELEMKRDVSRSALFDVFLNLNIADPSRVMREEEEMVRSLGEEETDGPMGGEKVVEVGPAASKFDMLFNLFEGRDGLSLYLEFNRDIYSLATIKGMIRHYKQLMRAIVAEPGKAISQLEYLLAEEKREILEEFNATAVIYDREETVMDLFERAVERCRDQVAVRYGASALSYGKLAAMSQGASDYLRGRYGIGRGDLVGIRLERSEWAVAVIWGILGLGAGYVPIDPGYPQGRIDYIIEDSGCGVVIDEEELEKIKSAAEEGEGEGRERQEGVEWPAAGIGWGERAYVIYTSGSTGRPKGVEISHGNLYNYVRYSMWRYFGEEGKVYRAPLFTLLSFDLTVTSIFCTLLSGGELVVYGSERGVGEVLEEIFHGDGGINIVKCTPGHLRLLGMSGGKEQGKETETGVDGVIVGGEALTGEDVGVLREMRADIRIYNEYGPTETTVGCVVAEIGGEEERVPIGKPIWNTRVYIVDEGLRPVGKKITGEICIGGAGVGLGYLNRAELTAERFVANPYRDGERMYRTGDLGRWREDGNIEYLGRMDDQVKIRGYRIELGEVEEALRDVEGISQAVVIVDEVGSEPSLVAYVVSGEVQDSGEMRRRLQEKLPEYMVPGYYMQLAALPLTANGKVDRKALPSVEERVLGSGRQQVGPRNAVEAALVECWRDVLKRETVSVKENFFDLGGDSIKAILVSGRMKQRGYTLRVGDILKNPLLERMAEYAGWSERETVQGAVEGDVELTAVQRWFLDGRIQQKHHFNQSVLLRRERYLDRKLVEGCLSALAAHHDGLRMVFRQQDGEWQQYNRGLGEGRLYALREYDLRGEADGVARMGALSNELQESMELSGGPLLRAGLFHMDDGDRLLLAIHHLIVDGVSWRILLEDLSMAYEQLERGETVKLPAKSDPFKEWAGRLREYAQGETVLGEVEYWRAVLEGGEESRLRLGVAANGEEGNGGQGGGGDRGRKGDDHLVGENGQGGERMELDAEMTGWLLREVSGVYHTEINDILLTALVRSGVEVFGSGGLLVELEGHGREEVLGEMNVTRTLGWFTTVYPVRLEAVEGEDWAESLVRVKEELRRVPNKGIGYGLLRYVRTGGRELLGLEAGTEAEADVIFNYLGDFGEGVGRKEGGEDWFGYSGEWRGRERAGQEEEGSGGVAVNGMIASGRLRLELSYSRRRYGKDQMAEWMRRYRKCLEEGIEKLRAEGRRHVTPSDLTYKGLRMAEVLALERVGEIEDVYGLSPLQEGIYYHWLSAPETTAYVEQVSYRIRGRLFLEALEESYRFLVSRHGVLRTSFYNEYGGGNLQVVWRSVVADFRYRDLREKEGEETGEAKERKTEGKEELVRRYKQADRAEGLDLSGGSPMRLSVLRIGEEEHEFVWSHHHILMDGWCGGILIQEFNSIYRNLVNGREPGWELKQTEPYVNYIRWLYGKDWGQSETYWAEYLRDYESLSGLPFGKRGDSGGRYETGREMLDIGREATAELRERCRELGITENTFIQGVWGYLLSRYNDTKDVVYGAVVSGRPGEVAGVEGMVGLFINTIPVRIRYEEETTVGELLQEIQAGAIESLPHHYVGLSKIQEGSMLRKGLFDHILTYENYPVEEMVSTGLKERTGLEELRVISSEIVEQTNYDFNLLVIPGLEATRILLGYNGLEYERESMRWIAGHIGKVIEAFAGSAEQRLAEIEYLSEAEREQLLEEFNDTAVGGRLGKAVDGGGIGEVGAGQTLAGLFVSQAMRNGEKIVCRFRDRTFSYGELDEWSDQLAGYLRERYDLHVEDIVGVRLRRSEWMIITLLAVIKSGCAYLPMDPSWPAERVSYIETDSGCRGIVDEEEIRKFLAVKDAYPAGPAGPVVTEIKETSLAYVIYTSGSTGKPKGCMLEHKGIVNRIGWMWEALGFNESDIILQKTTYTFDVSVWEIFMPLCWGCGMVLCEEEDVYSPVRIAELISAYQVSCVHFVPSLLEVFIKTGMDGTNLGTLRRIITSGEALAEATVRSWYGQMGAPIHNLYGPTEASVDVTWYDTSVRPGPVYIGKPIWNTQMYVLDKARRLMPVGAAGELCIGGMGLARGYLNRAELTAERFVASPYRGGERLYRTGDVGRWREDGNIEYLGRMDHQVKIRGYRIELGEVEEALREVEGIEQVVVVAAVVGGERALVAYVVSGGAQDSGAAQDSVEAQNSGEIRRRLQEKLPEYMVPGYYVQMAALPLTANGKVDRKALPPVEKGVMAGGRELVGPRNAVEEALVECWKDVLKRAEVSVKDNFFDLGGDSIRAILVSGRMKQRGYTLRVGDILKYPVLEDLAGCARRSEREAVQGVIEGDVELTAVQRWFLDGRAQQKHHYNQSVLLRREGFLDRQLVEGCLSALAVHHDGLRMVYRQQDGEWRQYNRGLGEGSLYELREYDLRGDADGVARMGVLSDELQGSMELSEGPLLRAGLFHMEDGDRLLLAIHHLVVDGVSWRILLEDLSMAYEQLERGETVKLPAKSDSFREWAGRLREYAQAEAVLEEAAYWRAVVKGEERRPGLAAAVVADGEGNGGGGRGGGQMELSREMTEWLLREVNGVYHTEINDILLTALVRSGVEVFGGDGLLVELEGHGREEVLEEVNVTRTVGWFTTIYPVRLAAVEGEDWTQTLVRVKEELRGIPNKGIGYGLLRYVRAGGGELLGGELEADVTFNYLGDFGEGVGRKEGGKEWFAYSEEWHGRERADQEIGSEKVAVNGMIVSGRLRLELSYSHRRYRKEQMTEWMRRYQGCLEEGIGRLRAEGRRHVTPSDLTYKGLRMEEVAELERVGEIEEVYGLSPLQEGIYYHWLSAPGTTAYMEQVSYRMQGRLSVEALEASYRYLVGRHGVLRTSFYHEYGGVNLQVVWRAASADFRYRDLKGKEGEKGGKEGKEQQVRGYKEADLAEGLDLSRRSQMRLSVLELGEEEYEFIWSHHHILMDGWCAGILVDEFYEIYRNVVNGQEPGWGLKQAEPYVNYIRWLYRKDRGESERYWAEYLRGYERLSGVPYKKGESGDNGSYDAKREELEIGREMTAGLRERCRELGITENTFIQGAWGYLLSRYNDTRDVVYGAVVSGRPDEVTGVEGMVGLFINTIPVRVQYEDETTVGELLQGIHARAIEGLPHHYVGLSSVLRSGLHDHILVFDNLPVEEMVSTGLREKAGLEELQVASSQMEEHTNYEFNLVVIPGPETIRILRGFNGRQYDRESIKRIGDHLVNVIEEFAGSADRRVAEIEYLSGEEKRRLLEEFNDTAVDGAHGMAVEGRDGGSGGQSGFGRTLAGMFASQVMKHGEKIGCRFRGQSFSYRELDEWSSQLAAYLKERYDLHAEDIVGVRLKRSEWMIITLLGVIKSGCAYLPMDPGWPADRVSFIEADSGYRVCVDEEEIKRFVTAKDGYPTSPVTADIEESSLACVIYTPGSTNNPMGCMLEHKGVVNRISWMWETLRFDTHDIILQKAAYTSDVAIWEIFLPLCLGCGMALCEEEDVHSPVRIAELISDYGVSCVHFAPGFLAAFIKAEMDTANLSSLRRVVTSGEALPEATVRSWYSSSWIPIYSLYGRPEASGDVAWYDTSVRPGPVYIGKPIRGMQIYILDKEQRLMPGGVSGEICIGGIGLARGYLNGEELTAERFAANPYRDGERLFRTGDLGRWREDGNIEYLGRIDENAQLPEEGVMQGGQEYVAPRNEIEQKLAGIWQEVLDVNRKIGIKDNLFELGGHSIKVIKILSKIHKDLDNRLTVRNLFEYPTIEEIATQIRHSNWLVGTEADYQEYEETKI
jgi:iturin family lipopeptide synthetase B